MLPARSFSIEAPPPNENPNDAMEREPEKIKTATEKGALWHEYDFLVHQFVAVFTLQTRL